MSSAAAPDPADCHNPVCGSKTDMFKAAMSGRGGAFGGAAGAKRQAGSAASGGSPSSASAAGAAAAGAAAADAAAALPCPVDREELGRQSWTLLHTMAAYYPNKPTAEDKTHAKTFMGALSRLYPCTHCAHGIREAIKESPVDADSREGLSVWMCRLHNRVNEELGKPTFSCTLSKLDARWRTGRPECWGDETVAEESLGHDTIDTIVPQ